jgi:ethanolamine utilization protein EutA
VTGPEHGHGHGHDDDHLDEDPLPLEDNPIWQQDNVSLLTVGMDIGSSGTQVVFSRLHLRRIAEDLSTRFVVVRREALHRSEVAFTPFTDGWTLAGTELGSIIDAAYAGAGIAPEEVDTGVVILTGEALRRRNSRAITEVLAERGGEFVTASAGHHLEATLAAHGSGAVQRSYDLGTRLLNVDIGGGTTKLTVVDRGRIVSTAAVHVGGRLITVADGQVDRLEPAAVAHARATGCDWSPGTPVTSEQLDALAATMADVVVAAVVGTEQPHWLTDPVTGVDGVDGVVFSGGVAEYVYGREERDFGDLGGALGRAVRERVDSGALPFPLLPAGECIRATVLGAAEFSVQLSGNTSHLVHADELLPRRNLQVVRPVYPLEEKVDADAVAEAVTSHLTAFDADPETPVALALTWSGVPEHARVAAFAEGVLRGLGERVASGQPLYLLLDRDVALTLGRLLRDELGVTNPVLVVDGLQLWDFDYIDLGRVRQPAGTLPVTVKSLVFTS